MCTQITRGAREQPALRPVKTPVVAAEPHPDRLGVCGPETSAGSELRVSLLCLQVQIASVQGCARVWLVFIINRLSGLLLNSLISQIVSEELLNVREKYSLHSGRVRIDRALLWATFTAAVELHHGCCFPSCLSC